MTDTSGEEEAVDPFEQAMRDLAHVIDGVVTEECVHAYHGPTQEHQLSSNIVGAIRTELRHFPLRGAQVDIEVQELPDRGRGSLEKEVGADLYISIIRHYPGGKAVSKGMLAQAKWDTTLPDPKLQKQSRDMIERSETDSTIWVYTPGGVIIVPASVTAHPLPDAIPVLPKTVGEMIADGGRCEAGDRRIGRRLDGPFVESMTSVLERLGARTGLGFEITPLEV